MAKKKKKKQQKKKLKIHTMDLILVIIAIILLVFTIDMRNIFIEKGAVPDVLVLRMFGILGFECGALSWIKTNKDKIAERKQQLRDRAYEKAQQKKEQQETEPKE